MPDNMRYDNNGQPMGYGDPMDPSMYGQPDPYGQYPQQGGYPGAMPSPQEIYAQQSYADPNQVYMDPAQGMYGGQPMQPDPYGQYPQQGGYMEPDPSMGIQQSYLDPDQQYMQQAPGYGQQPQMQQPYPGAQQPYGQPAPGAQSMMQPQPQQAQQMPAAQQMSPQMAAQPMGQAPFEPEPMMDKKAAKRAAKDQKRSAKQQARPISTGPEPPAGKAMLAMILGILSVIFALIPPIGIALGFVVRKISGDYMAQGGSSPKAETGRIFGTVGLIFSLIMLAVLIFLGIFIYAGLYGESQARSWSVFFNNSPFGAIWRIPIPSPL